MTSPIDKEIRPPAGALAKLPSLGSVEESAELLQRIKQILETMLGRRGNSQWDRVVTFRDLYDINDLPDGRGYALGPGSSSSPNSPRSNRVYAMGQLEKELRNTESFKTLMTRIGSVEDLARYPEEIRQQLQIALEDVARARKADIQTIEKKIQTQSLSYASTMREVTAALEDSLAGVRNMEAAYTNESLAMALSLRQVTARLNDVDGDESYVTVEERLLAQADSINGLLGQWSIKIQSGSGGANPIIAGISLSVEDPIAGPGTSSLVILADKFGIFTMGGAVAPFLVSGTDIELNGNVKINGSAVIDGTLSIVDAFGNVILSAGQALDPDYAAAGTKNSDIRLGSRNYYLNSQAVSEVNNNVGTGVSVPMSDEAVPYHRITSTPGTVISTYTSVYQWTKIPVGTQCVISCDVRAPVAGNVGFYSGQGMQAVPANKWVRISHPFTYDGATRLPGHTYAGSNILDYRNYKVEIGNIATDWSPAPEDVDGGIAAAAAQAALANAEIANITADNVLSKSEKSAVILQFTAIVAEVSDIIAKASAAGVSSAAYNTAYIDLNNYLPVGWNDPSTNTSIVGTTFRSMFASYYNQRQLLINATVAAAATTALWNTVTGNGKPSDNATSDMILIQDGIGLVVAGNNISRPTNGGAWNAGVWSSDSYAGGAFVSARVNHAASHFMFGLNRDPASSNGFDTIDWAIYCAAGITYIYESGFNPGSYGSYVVGDTFAVAYDGIYVRYMKNGAVFRVVPAAIAAPLHFDSSFNSSGGSITNVRFGPLTTATPEMQFALAGQGLTLQGSTLSRSGGSTWDASLRSVDGYTGGAACSFVPQAGAHFMMGLNTDPTLDSSYEGIDYCFYSNATTALIAVISGAQFSLGSYVPGQDVLSISYDNSCVAWSKNGEILKTVATIAGQKFHLDSSIVDGTISNIRFGQMSAAAAGTYWLNSTGMVVSGSTFRKVGASGWNQEVYSSESYTGGAYAKGGVRTGSLMFGLNQDPAAGSSYETLDYSIYLDGSGGMAVYESNVGLSTGSYTNGDSFMVRYNGSNVQYSKNGTVFRTISAPANLKFHFDSSFNSNGAVLENAEFGPLSDVSAGVTALSGLADKLNKAGADTISGPISLTAANAILVGTTNDGIFYGSTGIYGRKAGSTTFSVAADGTALFAGGLVAASGTFGSVTIAAGGSISSGQTAYATGDGFWMGLVSGVAKLSMGNATQYLRYNGTSLEIKFPQIILSSVADVSSPSGANGTRFYGSRTVTIVSGGTGPFTYNWYMASNYLGRITLSGTSTATVSVFGTATNDGNSGVLVCVVTDSNNLSATVSCGVTATHGSPP